MISPVRRLLGNLRPRLRLLQIAFGKRFVWDDLSRLVLTHGVLFGEVHANVHPLRFASWLSPKGPSPDFAVIGPSSTFAPPNAPTWNSEPSVGAFLGELAYWMKPAVVVELGCYVGWTSAHLALGLKAVGGGGRLWCLDSHPTYLGLAQKNLARLDLGEAVTFLQGLSLAPEVEKMLPERIDLLFIDTTHEYEDTKKELALYGQRMAPNGLIVLHDSISHVGVRRVLLEVVSDYEIMTFGTEFGNGVTVLRRANR